MFDLFEKAAVVSNGEVWIRSNIDKWLYDVSELSFRLESDAITTATLARGNSTQLVVGNASSTQMIRKISPLAFVVLVWQLNSDVK